MRAPALPGENRSRPRVLVVSHGAAATGFSRVVHALIESLAGEYDFHHLATNHRADAVPGAWPVYGIPGPLDAYGLERLERLIARLRPRLVLMLQDLWFCCVHAARLHGNPERPATIAYCPVDGTLTRPELYRGLRRFDQLVAYNRFGASQLAKIAPERVASPPAACAQGQLEVIAHGIDHGRFFPLSPAGIHDRACAKRRLFGERAADTGFVVLNAAKHDARKRIDLTVEGFARFAHDKPADVKLHLHTAAVWEGLDLRALARRAGVADRLISSDGWLRDHPSVDDERLNLIYNAADVGVNTSCGEGWGLVSCEHAATGAPQLTPRHSGCAELWSETATTLPVRDRAEHVGLGMLREAVGAADVARLLERLYRDAGFRAEQALAAHRVARREEYRWPRVAERWDALFQRVLARRQAHALTRSPPARR